MTWADTEIVVYSSSQWKGMVWCFNDSGKRFLACELCHTPIYHGKSFFHVTHKLREHLDEMVPDCVIARTHRR